MTQHNATKHPTWFSLYTAALFEEDETKIMERIRAAKAAVESRSIELRGDGTAQESCALANALYFLNVLQNNELCHRGIYAASKAPSYQFSAQQIV